MADGVPDRPGRSAGAAAVLQLEISGAACYVGGAGRRLSRDRRLRRAQAPAVLPLVAGTVVGPGLRDLYRSTALVGANVLIQVGTSGVVMLVSAGLGAARCPRSRRCEPWRTSGRRSERARLADVPEIVRYHALRDGKKLVAAVEAYWLIANNVMNLSILSASRSSRRSITTGPAGESSSTSRCSATCCCRWWRRRRVADHELPRRHQRLRATAAIYAARGLVPIVAGLALHAELRDGREWASPSCWASSSDRSASDCRYFRRSCASSTRCPRFPRGCPRSTGSASVAVFLLARAVDSPARQRRLRARIRGGGRERGLVVGSRRRRTSASARSAARRVPRGPRDRRRSSATPL